MRILTSDSLDCRASAEPLGPAAVSPRQPVDPILVLIPVYREAPNLRAAVEEIRRAWPALPILVVDDGSRDGTADVLAELERGAGVRSLCLPRHAGLGHAVRAGLAHAWRLGYRTVVRLDGDGQHAPSVIAPLLAPIAEGRADAVQGSFFLGPGVTDVWGLRRVVQWTLARVLSTVTRHPVTDPTSGCWAFGPRAVPLLAAHHPGGYPEPGLRLLLHRHRQRVAEVAVRVEPRRGGRSSLTLGRTLLAGGRVVVALGGALLRPRHVSDPADTDGSSRLLL